MTVITMTMNMRAPIHVNKVEDIHILHMARNHPLKKHMYSQAWQGITHLSEKHILTSTHRNITNGKSLHLFGTVNLSTQPICKLIHQNLMGIDSTRPRWEISLLINMWKTST